MPLNTILTNRSIKPPQSPLYDIEKELRDTLLKVELGKPPIEKTPIFAGVIDNANPN